MRACLPSWVCLLSLLLAGCEPRDLSHAMLQDYAFRVANVLGSEPVEPAKPDLLLTLPPRRDRILETGDFRIGLFDFLDLKACDMRHLVSQRNSVLGKVMPPSRQLVYEVHLVQALQACEKHLAQFPPEDAEFTELISQALIQKREELPRVIWNASFASEEIEHTLSLTRGTLQPGTKDLLRSSARELRWFAKTMRNVQTEQSVPTIDNLEKHYQALAFNPAPGQLFQSIVLAIQWLDYVAGLLEQTDVQRLCPQKVPTQKARILQTVFSKFYAGEVQAWISMLHREGGEWQSAIRELLEAQQVTTPPAFGRYAQRMLDSAHPDSLRARLDASIAFHTDQWKRVFGHCGIMPSVDTLRESAARELP